MPKKVYRIELNPSSINKMLEIGFKTIRTGFDVANTLSQIEAARVAAKQARMQQVATITGVAFSVIGTIGKGVVSFIQRTRGG